MQVRETIPEHLRREVDAALRWWNGREDVPFEVTGIVDPDAAHGAPDGRELRLVLCGGDRCEQRSFRVKAAGDGYEVTLLDEERIPGAPPPELDPPPGALRGWLDRELARNAFVVLLFYRGYW